MVMGIQPRRRKMRNQQKHITNRNEMQGRLRNKSSTCWTLTARAEHTVRSFVSRFLFLPNGKLADSCWGFVTTHKECQINTVSIVCVTLCLRICLFCAVPGRTGLLQGCSADFFVDLVGRDTHGSDGDWFVTQWSSGLLEEGWGFQGLPTTGVLGLTTARERVRNTENGIFPRIIYNRDFFLVSFTHI